MCAAAAVATNRGRLTQLGDHVLVQVMHLKCQIGDLKALILELLTQFLDHLILARHLHLLSFLEAFDALLERFHAAIAIFDKLSLLRYQCVFFLVLRVEALEFFLVLLYEKLNRFVKAFLKFVPNDFESFRNFLPLSMAVGAWSDNFKAYSLFDVLIEKV